MLALFDLNNTLIDRRGSLEDWARGFVRQRRLLREAESAICDRLRSRAYPADFVHLRETLGLSDDPDDLWRGYVEVTAWSVRCFPGVRESLEALRGAGWDLGVATNGAGDIQWAKLAATGLTSLFDGIRVPEEIGARKPAYDHFEVAASLCGTRPQIFELVTEPDRFALGGSVRPASQAAVRHHASETVTASYRTRSAAQEVRL
ncbi:HAD family hydrolase [Streptomyces sp. NPDC059378]|uniref:HAD family hydrolase n=1 Tax=Streptomyces sp. NPDC059378 TaxID=3346815 RepID=UPI0036B1CAAB